MYADSKIMIKLMHEGYTNIHSHKYLIENICNIYDESGTMLIGKSIRLQTVSPKIG